MMGNMEMRIGWAKPPFHDNVKFHFFSRGWTLCGRYKDSGNVNLDSIDDPPVPDQCKGCWRRHRRG